MTFSKIAFKMFKADIKKYRLFILCNLSAIAILYSFVSVSENQQFMNKSIVDPTISGDIYAPTFLILVFNGIFIMYSQSIFMKARQKDYGILLTIGMTENEVRNSILIENLILCIISLITGLLFGTFLSALFLGFIRNVIGIDKIDVTISVVSYKITAIYVSVIFIISLIINVCGMIKSTIYEKIKYAVKAESGNHYSIKFICVGIVITIAAFILMILFYNKNTDIAFLSIIFCILGSVLIFFNGEALIEYFKNKHYGRYIKNIFLFSDIKYYYGKNKKIFFATTWIFFVMIFFVALSAINYPYLKNDVITFHPFHIAYGEIKNHFQLLEDDEIQTIARNNGNNITSIDTVNFVRNNSFTIFCVDDVNRILKTNYEVKPNSFIHVFPYDMNDGYEHSDNMKISRLYVNSHEGSKKFIVQDIVTNPLFGQLNCISDNVFIANKEDYEWITLNDINFYLKGILHLYNLDNWHNSQNLVNEVANKLSAKNNIETEVGFYKTSSRIEAYNTALKSSKFLIFNSIYVCLLLYFSSIIMIHFKFKMEYKDEKRKYFNLYKIGIEEIEIKKIISQKILMIYFVPFVYAIIISIAFSYYGFSLHGLRAIGILYTFIISFIFLIIHLIVYKLYFKVYYSRVISEFK
jgi:putative ABC transport system permease protein